MHWFLPLSYTGSSSVLHCSLREISEEKFFPLQMCLSHSYPSWREELLQAPRIRHLTSEITHFHLNFKESWMSCSSLWIWESYEADIMLIRSSMFPFSLGYGEKPNPEMRRAAASMFSGSSKGKQLSWLWVCAWSEPWGPGLLCKLPCSAPGTQLHI